MFNQPIAIADMLSSKIALIALALAAAAPTNPDAIVPDSEFVETTQYHPW